MLEKLYNIKINVNLLWHYFQARSNIQFRLSFSLIRKQHDQVGEWNMKKGVERGCHCKTEDHWAGPKNKYTISKSLGELIHFSLASLEVETKKE